MEVLEVAEGEAGEVVVGLLHLHLVNVLLGGHVLGQQVDGLGTPVLRNGEKKTNFRHRSRRTANAWHVE